MSTDKHTEAPPLDPHTLRVVIDRLGERIKHAETERENDASEGLPADEMADWDTRIEALELARWDIENIAKTANPRARVVVLPEPYEVDDDGQVYFDDLEIRVDTTGTEDFPNVVIYKGEDRTAQQAYNFGLEWLAAGIACGAK